MLLDITEDELQEISEEIGTILGAWDISVDLTKKEILVMLRRGLKEFNKETSIWQLRNQFANVYGMPAGEVLNQQLATFNMNIVTQITDWFASMSKTGGKIPWKKDYIELEPGRQIYDLSKESSKPYVSGTRRINRVMWHQKPASLAASKFDGNSSNIQGDDVLNSSAWSFSNAGLNYGGQPLSFLGYAFDSIMLLQSLSTRQKVLFSEFYHNLSGDILELLPMPGGKALGIDQGSRVFYYYFDERDVLANKRIEVTNEDDYSLDSEMISGADQVLISSPAYLNITSVPWSMLSDWAKNWCWEYTLARCKYIQAAKWRKIKKNFASGEMEYEIEFDYDSLLQESKEELLKLKDDLRSDLEKMNMKELYADKQEMIQTSRDANKNYPRTFFFG